MKYQLFQPRPDDPENWDQQTAFFNSKNAGVTFLLGGNGAGTTETALGKVARFVLHQQPPPRADTPFWIIAGSYEQVMKACWKEKLHGHGRIPDSEVDWRRIRWYREKDGLPYTVPLKPWPGRPGKSWTLCFKSYEQGRQQMQAESIGGFLFVEQFPWGLLEEVLRGCREYDFVGNKLAEFTPVDPLLSEPLEAMMEEDTLPPDWGVYHANTECALKAGHITQQWFNTFFGMVSEEMRPTRMRGAFGGYEGLIYQRFSPTIHIIDDDQAMDEMVAGVFHSRGMDWGAGPENPFGCVWGYRTGTGACTIYDEYYSNDQNFTTHDHLKSVCDQWPWPAQHPCYGETFADPSDPGNIRLASKFSRYCDGYDNFNITPARNAVHEGIEYVQYMLAKNPVIGRPLLRISKRCKNLIRELKAYRWEKSSDRGINPRDAKPVPLKKNDHLCDALRYLLFSQADRLGHTAEAFSVVPDAKRHGVQLKRTRQRGR